MPTQAISERFWAKVDVRGPDECWPWTAWRNHKGYGQFGVTHGFRQGAHRVAWTLANGPIPEGLHVLHSCDNPPCCNAAHLRLGTNAENQAEKAAKGRSASRSGSLTHCLKGHEFNEENTYVFPSGRRYCRPCQRVRRRAHYERSIAGKGN